ncbi:MAG TPA: triphosphoribosyl-dephospho-CoA synthase [Bacillota bacterium]|nr:triphosphoribosyl-dephospho-CoA synthase [Bacillota bacterium]HPF42223.1 triphosphoribosyl-dephospho-CoA synthase [Bacillota bacterium]HPJ86432.1 triphosphoribosyl-dephospho-CoA synthase [Bacillota bacterium]HPQ61778.1 triphosphoribosyl-dephospho-CoA synthase [Bacillota bacterium]HRX91466.1 triphosphoribosyl-dephospho-CoA synthase [Candidatus Izemoplasmatales bacterium]
METKPEDILNDREKRANMIALFLRDRDVVVTIRANIPGPDKRLPGAYVLIRHFSKLFYPEQQNNSLFVDGADGPTIFRFIDNVSAKDLKKEAEWFENTEEVGRLLDIDVHTKEGTLHRDILRKCVICDDYAVNCVRAKKHDQNEVLRIYQEIFDDKFMTLLQDVIDKAIMAELNLDPKFGLVTPTSSGSHRDMDYAKMLKAKDAIIPYLTKMFIVALRVDVEKNIFPEIRKIGQEAEKAMFRATNGVNAYKGLIFSLGIIIASTAMVLHGKGQFERIFIRAEELSSGLVKELETGHDTFGKIAYQKYGIAGARKEAEMGFPLVSEALKTLNDIYDPLVLTKTLVYLIGTCEDTVFLKRSVTIEDYHKYQNMFKDLTDFSEGNIKKMTDYCIEHNLSFGGSADLLVVAAFLEEFRKTFHLDIPTLS